MGFMVNAVPLSLLWMEQGDDSVTLRGLCNSKIFGDGPPKLRASNVFHSRTNRYKVFVVATPISSLDLLYLSNELMQQM